MSLRSARRAAREAYHRHAHIDTEALIPDHSPERCEVGLDIDGGRLDSMLAALWPIVRRFAVQEHARRYGRRTVQFTPAEVQALRLAIAARTLQLGEDRSSSQQRLGLRRIVAKLADLDT